MDHKVDTRRIDKRSAKKDRSDGPYSAKHVRHLEQMMEISSSRTAKNKAVTSSESVGSGIGSGIGITDTEQKQKQKQKHKKAK